MTDVMPPQIAQPQVTVKPVKAVGKTPEVAQESESNQGFSNVLKERMQPEKEAGNKVGDKPPVETAAPQKTERATTDDTADGKPLPLSGNAEENLVATLMMETAEQPPSEKELDTKPDTTAIQTDQTDNIGIIIPDSNALATAVADTGSVKPSKDAAASVTDAVAAARQGPWPTAGARAQLPEPTHTVVAQAVKDAITDRDAALLTAQTQERLGADVRVFAAGAAMTGQPRAPGFEALLDRAMPAVQHSQPTSTLPQGLQALLPQDTTTATARPVLPTTTVETPFRQSGWDQALGDRVLWAANQKLQSAEIKLNPPQLGPIEVRVQMHHDQAQVSFTAQHASVRDALEAAAPRLREMFSANGFNLVDVNVSQHSFAEQQRQAAQGFGNSSGGGQGGRGDGDDATISIAPQQELSRPGGSFRNGIDLFA